MWDSLFLFSLGFLGSFGHCVGMCGPLMLVMGRDRDWRSHIWLQVGRLLSYTLAGLLMGGLSAVLIDGAQWAGIGSDVRRWVAVGSGLVLIWLGLGHVQLLPQVQHPLLRWHRLIEDWMGRSQSALVLGLIWGLMPCGFLYTAQLRALSLGNVWLGGAAMLAFGLGTLPTLLGVGLALQHIPLGKRQALFRLGGWLTIAIGLVTLLRTGGHLWDSLAYGALILLSLALLARPLQPVWPQLLPWRRGMGLVGFGLAMAHSLQSVAHHWQWRWQAWRFLIVQHQVAVGFGVMALLLLLPAACTSFSRAQKQLGQWWRQIHLLAVPALLLALTHATLISARFLGGTRLLLSHKLLTLAMITLGVAIVTLRTPWAIRWLRRWAK